MSGASMSMLFARIRSALFRQIMPRTETDSPSMRKATPQGIGVLCYRRASPHFDHFNPALSRISGVNQINLVGQNVAEDAFQHGVLHEVRRVQTKPTAVIALMETSENGFSVSCATKLPSFSPS